MNARVGTIALACLALLAVPVTALGQEAVAGEPAEHAVIAVDGIEFAPIEVPGFDSGMMIAVIHGDPNAESGDYTLRLAFPDGYRFPPHWHPKAEHLTVLSGTFLLEMGKTADESALKRYAPGDFLYLPAEKPHYGGAEGTTSIQLHGQAPFEIYLAEASE